MSDTPAPRTVAPRPDDLVIAYMPEAENGPWLLLQEDPTVIDFASDSPVLCEVSGHKRRQDAVDARDEVRRLAPAPALLPVEA